MFYVTAVDVSSNRTLIVAIGAGSTLKAAQEVADRYALRHNALMPVWEQTDEHRWQSNEFEASVYRTRLVIEERPLASVKF